MKSVILWAETRQAMRAFLTDDLQGTDSIVEILGQTVPETEPWTAWRTLPAWLNAPDTWRIRPGWLVEGWRHNDTRFPASWFEYDEDGNVTAEPTYQPGVLLILSGPQAEFSHLREWVKDNDPNYPRDYGGVRGAQVVYDESGWIRFLHGDELRTIHFEGNGIPWHATTVGENYTPEDETAPL